MEEQNQEKATATQHVTVADAAAPETGNGKKEDKGGGKKEKKTAKPLTPKQLQQRKKLMVYPLMGLLFLGSMWLIFAPSEERDVNRDTVGAFNADIPLPENDGIIGDKRKAYEQAQAEKQQAEKVRSLEDFAFSEESDTDGVEMELPDSEPEREPFRDYSDNGGGSRSSVTAYRDINRQLGSFYEEPKVDGEKEELKRQVEELTAKLEERERQAGGIDDQVALMEKSYELAAKYMGQNGRDGAAVQVPATGQDGNGLGQPAVAVQVARPGQAPVDLVREIVLPRTDRFFVGIADVTAGSRSFDAAKHELLGDAGDHRDDFVDGRLAFYFKGVVRNDWRLTASADTGEQPLKSLFDGFLEKDPRSLLRRIDRVKKEDLNYGTIRIDVSRHTVQVDGNEVELTYKEYEILKYLMKNRGIVLTRDSLMEKIWGYDFEHGNRTVDVHIQSLRKKLGTAGDAIKTIRNVGYKIGD